MAEGKGWIKLHRSILDWEWWKDEKTLRVFIYLLLNATTKPIKYCGIDLEPGEFISGDRKIANELGISYQNARTAIKHLKSTHEITTRTTNKYTIYKVENWSKFQGDNAQDNIRLTSNQRTTNEQLTHKQESKESKECKEGYVKQEDLQKNGLQIDGVCYVKKPTMEEFKKFTMERGLTLNPVQIYKQLDLQGWVFNGRPIQNWQGLLISWDRKYRQAQASATPAQVSGYSNNNKIDTGLPDWYHKTEKKPASDELYAQAISLQAELRNNKESS